MLQLKLSNRAVTTLMATVQHEVNVEGFNSEE